MKKPKKICLQTYLYSNNKKVNSFNLTDERKKILDTSGHILVLGGPGSGKTTIALLKAGHHISSNFLKPRQNVLFLSFARATVGRVAELAGILNSASEQKNLIIETYHGFAWNLLRSHGYLLNQKPIRLLPPPQAASRLAEIKNKEDRAAEKTRLLKEEGLLHFDLFAKKAYELLSKSDSLSRIFTDTYPIIILDEFQDTNLDEWLMIQELGKHSSLIALADAEQRIYDFRGADPKRIGEFITTYSPTQFDFGSENNRSNGTDIINFGNDLLNGSNLTKQYTNVVLEKYQTRSGASMHLQLKITTLEIIGELNKTNPGNWSLAILVPSKQLMLDVSDYLGSGQRFSNGKKLVPLSHEVALETSGPSLSALLIAGLLECKASQNYKPEQMILDLCAHIRGRKGGDGSVNKTHLSLTEALTNYTTSGIVKGPKRKEIIDECKRILAEIAKITLTGDPGEDWLTVRRFLSDSTSKEIKTVAEDAKYLRLLHKGASLRLRLGELWRKHGSYLGSISAVHSALLQEHFSASVREKKGIQIMTIHKSKGKEFDQVIIYEGNYNGRIVRSDASDEDIAKARLTLRVGVTRAKAKVMILTPNFSPCPFLF